MGKIYVGQTKLRIQRTVSQNITSGTAIIKYRKPSGSEGSWTATISDAANGVFYFDVVLTSTLDEAGTWITWGHVTFSDTRVAAGQPVEMRVYREGT